MRQKLACLAVVVSSVYCTGASAQFVSVRGDAGVGSVSALGWTPRDDARVSAPAFSLTHAGSHVDEAIALSDSERFQLRQQIRDAAQDIYAEPTHKPAVSRDAAARRLR